MCWCAVKKLLTYSHAAVFGNYKSCVQNAPSSWVLERDSLVVYLVVLDTRVVDEGWDVEGGTTDNVALAFAPRPASSTHVYTPASWGVTGLMWMSYCAVFAPSLYCNTQKRQAGRVTSWCRPRDFKKRRRGFDFLRFSKFRCHVTTLSKLFTQTKAPFTAATLSKQHSRMQQVERFFRQRRILLWQSRCRFRQQWRTRFFVKFRPFDKVETVNMPKTSIM